MKKIITVAVAALGFVSALAAQVSAPNILVVLSDDHSAPHLGCYGNPDVMTPNLDKFASQGVRFDRAYVTSPQCAPSRASIFTGRSPLAVGMSRFAAPLPREFKTFPEYLREKGWFTGVAGRSHHMDADGYVKSSGSKDIIERHHLVTFPDRFDYVKTTLSNDVALVQMREFLDLKPTSKPFFLQLCSTDPHRPLNTHGPVKHDPNKIKLPASHPDTPKIREDFARYYDEIAHFDGFFGQVMAELEKRGLSENTIVVFMGDNGASQFRGKGTLYELGIHVPLLVRWPGRVSAGRSSGELISGEDLAPTLLEAAGVAVPAEMTGKSILPLLEGRPFVGRDYVFSQRGPHGIGLPTQSAAFDIGRVVITKTHKLIYNAMWQIPFTPLDYLNDAFWKELVQMHKEGKLSEQTERLYFAPHRPMFELFNLAKDPDEFVNLAGKPEAIEVENKLKKAMQEWMILERDIVNLPIPAGNSDRY